MVLLGSHGVREDAVEVVPDEDLHDMVRRLIIFSV
jgi:hypothetical protein